METPSVNFSTLHILQQQTANTTPSAGVGTDTEHTSLFGELVDVINPLQHIPILSTLYRSATGDAVSSGAKIAGGGLYGGPVGLISGALNALLAEITGEDVGEHVMSAVVETSKDASKPDAFYI